MKLILKMKLLFLATIIWLFILSNSCKHIPEWLQSDLPVNDSTLIGIPCSADTIYFNRDIAPLLATNCAMSGCHDATTHAEGVNLSVYSKIMSTGGVKPGSPTSSKLYTVTLKSNPQDRMPPSPSPALTTDQKTKLYKWIAQGAQNNYCYDCDSTAFKFNLNILPIIQNNCTGCHNSGNTSGGVMLTNYSEITTALVGNRLQNTIAWTGVKNMPPSIKLPSCKIDNINKWIANGALNN